MCEVISLPLIFRKSATSLDVVLLMVPIEPWQNCTPFFGAVAFCMKKLYDFRTTCPCRSHIERLHYPAFAAFFGLVWLFCFMNYEFEIEFSIIYPTMFESCWILGFSTMPTPDTPPFQSTAYNKT